MKNRFVEKGQSGFFQSKNILLPILTVAACLFLLIGGLGKISKTTESQQKQSIERAIMQGAAHCYATEGSYPQDIQYLKDHYGLSYDEKKYFVDYSVFATNIVPDVTVITLK